MGIGILETQSRQNLKKYFPGVEQESSCSSIKLTASFFNLTSGYSILFN
jgi:hypothetical protein